MELILSHFPGLTDRQISDFEKLESLYQDWNSKINVISRKDLDGLYEKHVLHSLSIAGFFEFSPGMKILDIGTGGGFPGIPLAILFPDVQFSLSDSIAKKIVVVKDIVEVLDLKNVQAFAGRAEAVEGHFDAVVARAVTRLAPLYAMIEGKLNQFSDDQKAHGLIALKGGDLEEEIEEFLDVFPDLSVDLYPISEIFDTPFFETKKVVHVHP
jgi:16S rRNA (guanine527-N7)-methyltransferase